MEGEFLEFQGTGGRCYGGDGSERAELIDCNASSMPGMIWNQNDDVEGSVMVVVSG